MKSDNNKRIAKYTIAVFPYAIYDGSSYSLFVSFLYTRKESLSVFMQYLLCGYCYINVN